MQQIRDDLYLIDLDQTLEGYRQLIGAWVFRMGGMTVLVDPGPAATIPLLVDQLRQSGFDQVDHILLSHIHLDHAGGTGHLLRYFPEAKVNCHPKGIPHLLNPQKLWEESKKVLGPVAEAYGEMVPVPASNISWSVEIPVGGTSVEAIETPGHAPHHAVYRVGDILFAGELGGVFVPLENGYYCRPTTPPPFRHEIYRNSIVQMSALDVSLVCLGHYGCSPDVEGVFEKAVRQLDFWVETVGQHLWMGSGDAFEETVLADLIANDPDMKMWPALPPDIQVRERGFCFTNIRGIRGYLAQAEAK